MAKSDLNVAEIARVESLGIDELRQEWRRLHQTPPPNRLSRDILLRGIMYKLQERAFGGLSKATLRKLRPSAARCRARRRLPISFKPGTRLVREWHGQTHTVVILGEGSNGGANATAPSQSSRVRSRAHAGRDRGSSD